MDLAPLLARCTGDRTGAPAGPTAGGLMVRVGPGQDLFVGQLRGPATTLPAAVLDQQPERASSCRGVPADLSTGCVGSRPSFAGYGINRPAGEAGPNAVGPCDTASPRDLGSGRQKGLTKTADLACEMIFCIVFCEMQSIAIFRGEKARVRPASTLSDPVPSPRVYTDQRLGAGDYRTNAVSAAPSHPPTGLDGSGLPRGDAYSLRAFAGCNARRHKTVRVDCQSFQGDAEERTGL